MRQFFILICQFLCFFSNFFACLQFFLFLLQLSTQLVDSLTQQLTILLQFCHPTPQNRHNIPFVSQSKLFQFSRSRLLQRLPTLDLLHIFSLDIQVLRPRSPFLFWLGQMCSYCLQTLSNELCHSAGVLFSESLHSQHDHVQRLQHLLSRTDRRQQDTFLLFREYVGGGFDVHHQTILLQQQGPLHVEVLQYTPANLKPKLKKGTHEQKGKV